MIKDGLETTVVTRILSLDFVTQNVPEDVVDHFHPTVTLALRTPTRQLTVNAHVRHTSMVKIVVIPITHVLDVIHAATVVPELPTLTVFRVPNTPLPLHTAHVSATHTGQVMTAAPAPYLEVSAIRSVTDVADQLLLNVSSALPTHMKTTLDNVSVMTIITVMIVHHSNKMPDTTQSVTPSVLVAAKEELLTTVTLVLTTPPAMLTDSVNAIASGLEMTVQLTPTHTPRPIHATPHVVDVLAQLNSTALSVLSTPPKTCTENVHVAHTGMVPTAAHILLTTEDVTPSVPTVLDQPHTTALAVYQVPKETCTALVNANLTNLVMTVAPENHSPVTPNVAVMDVTAQQSATVSAVLITLLRTNMELVFVITDGADKTVAFIWLTILTSTTMYVAPNVKDVVDLALATVLHVSTTPIVTIMVYASVTKSGPVMIVQ